MQRNGGSHGWSRKVLFSKFMAKKPFFIHFPPHISESIFSHFPLFFCSQYYTRFKSYCCEAYNILRKSSNLILNLFHLMAGSNIPDIASDPEKGILKVISNFIILASSSSSSFVIYRNLCLCFHVAPREVPSGLGRRRMHTLFPGSHQRERQRSVPSNG